MKKIIVALLIVVVFAMSVVASAATLYVGDIYVAGRGYYDLYNNGDGRYYCVSQQGGQWLKNCTLTVNGISYSFGSDGYTGSSGGGSSYQNGKWFKDAYGWHFCQRYSDGKYYSIVSILADLNKAGLLYQAGNGENPFKGDGYCRDPYWGVIKDKFIYYCGDIYYADNNGRWARNQTVIHKVNNRWAVFNFGAYDGALEYYYCYA